MKKYLINTFMLVVLFTVASCLPQEKTTQCGEGEAFNPTQRRCVATLADSTDSISISNVGPTSSYAISLSDGSRTHSVSVSDPFNIGYAIKWLVTQPNGTTTLVGTGSSFTFVHTAYPTGSYVLEVQLLTTNGTTVLDTRSWTVNVIAETKPTLAASTATPFATTITSPATLISATASNPDSISNVNYAWYVNGTVVAGQSGTFSSSSQAVSFSFDPTSASAYFANAGTYSVQLIISENVTAVIYDSLTWTITNNIPGFASISLASATSGTATGNLTPNTATIITALDELDIGAGGFKYDHDGNIATALQDIDFCVQADNITGVDSNGVYVDFLENGVAIPNGTGILLATANTSYCLGAAIAAATATYSLDIPVSLATESRTISAVVYDAYSGVSAYPSYNGGTEVTRYNWTTRVRQLNTPPIITIDTVNTGSGGKIACGSASSTTMGTCAVTQDTAFNVAITVTDDDYNPADFVTEYQYFRVQFYLDGTLIDNSHPLSASDCYHTFSETASSARYICPMVINSYDSNGPINPTGKSYTITAVVDDSQSPYSVAGSNSSNTATWLISSVTAYDSGATINAFDETAAVAPTATQSFLSEQSTPGNSIDLNANANVLTPQIKEGDNLIFNIAVNEPERDSHFIKIIRCDDKSIACATQVTVDSFTVNSTDATNPRRTAITIPISQNAVIGDNAGYVYYKIIVRTDSGSVIDLDDEVVFLAVENTNINPVFNTANYSPVLNTVGTPLIAFSGFPITIDPGAITDASATDGDTILYQWMIAVDSDADGVTSDETYAVIEGATSKVLNWSPGKIIDFAIQTGTMVTIKLCMGDDGWDNALDLAKTAVNAGATNCLNATLDSGEWFFKSYTNIGIGHTYNDNTVANTSSGPIDVWIDPSSKDPLVKYMAYVNVNKEIIIEKIVTTALGAKGGTIEKTVEEMASVVFNSSTDASFAANTVTNLSISGDATNDALYISYMAPVSGVDIVHVRRIDISGGKTNASLLHDGKFGWDPGYDSLLDNFTPGAGLSEAIDGNGGLEITVTADAATQTGMLLTMINLHGGSSSLSAGTDFCVPTSICTTTTITANEIVTAVNNSTANEFQGFTATSAGAIITMAGVYQNDWIEADIGATSIGDIMINKTSGKWQLPFINHDLSGGDKHKIAIYQGNLNSRLTDSGPVSSAILGTIPSQEIANDILESDRNADSVVDVDSNSDTVGEANDSIIIITKALGTGEIAFYELNSSLTIIDSSTDLFVNTGISDIKVTVSQNGDNPSAYIMGRNSSQAFAYARIDHVLGNFNLAGATTVLNLDNSFALFAGDNVGGYDIAAGGLANQLLMVATDNTNANIYLVQIKGVSPTADCSYDNDQDLSKCNQLTDASFDLPVAIGDVFEDITIGSDGSIANQSTNDIAIFGMHVDDGGGVIAADALPILGVINVTPTDSSGTSNTAATKYAIPYINN